MKFNHTAHKKMWTWLSVNPEMEKEDWLGWKCNGGDYDNANNNCFACEFSEDAACPDCPIIWPSGHCMGEGGIYDKWDMNHDDEERSSLAHQIANLPVKEGVETE